MSTGSSRPALPSVNKSPGSPPTWSPWKCEMKMVPSARNPQPSRRIETCVPSPQSISERLPLTRNRRALRARSGRGIAPPVPRRQRSIIWQ